MRLILMSTPAFGIPTLHALMEGGHDVVGLVCQPDKPAGRGLRMTPPPMKQAAIECGIPVYQPASLYQPEAIRELAAAHPDLILVAAYGKFVPGAVTALAPLGALNLHPSLLPRWRGACPVPAAILAGDQETGVTVHFVVDEMDAGAILGQLSLAITPRDRAGDLMARLAESGARLYVAIVDAWVAGRIEPRIQDHSWALWCDRLTKAQGELDWTKPAEFLARQIRAFDPWPGTFTFWQGVPLRVLDAEPWSDWRDSLAPGQVFCTGNGLAVATCRGALILRSVQAPGKAVLPIDQFANGRRGFSTALLGR